MRTPGVRYTRLSARTEWTFKPTARWLSLVEKGRTCVAMSPDHKARDCVHVGPVFVPGEPKEIIFVHIERHAKDDRSRVVSMFRSPRPRSDPPPEVIESEKRVGGAKGLRAILERAGSKSSPPIAAHVWVFEVDAEYWQCKLVPRPILPGGPDEAVLSNIGPGDVEHIGYRIRGGASGIEEIDVIYHHAAKRFRVTVQCSTGLAFDDTLKVPAAVVAVDLAFDSLFSPTGGSIASTRKK